MSLDKKIESTDDKLKLCIKSLESSKALDIVFINVKENSSITDYMIICTGTSNRHVCAIADRLDHHLHQFGIKGVTLSGQSEGLWVIADIGDVIVHVQQQEARDRYQLEHLYRCVASEV